MSSHSSASRAASSPDGSFLPQLWAQSAALEARRNAIVAAWRDSPTRFREDANAEEDLLHGGYADRLLVELCANAADAGAGRVLITLRDGVLSVANDGHPLTEAGLNALTSLRASSKREGSSTGRFGVGFAAVLSVTDAPELTSVSGGVQFSAELTAAVIADIPHLRAEYHRRGTVPILRLPWEPSAAPAAGWVTEVRLPLRDAAAVAAVTTALAEFDPTLLLALDIPEVSIMERVFRRDDIARDWRLVHREGHLDPALLADRPTEERTRSHWWVAAAVPRGASLAAEQVVHAPTPSGEQLSLPVRLIGTFPLDPTRRHIPAGPLTDFLIVQAAEAIVDLIAADPRPHGELLAALTGGFAASPFDAAVRGRVLAALRERPWLPGKRLPRDAVAVPDALVEPLSQVFDGVLPAGWYRTRILTSLGARSLSIAEIVDALAGVDRPPAWWRSLYAALVAAEVDPGELGALPVPLAEIPGRGGRTVIGPRGVLLPDTQLPTEAVTALGLRVVHPEAVHLLLERLGARPAGSRAVLMDDAVRAAVRNSYEAADPQPIAAAVMDLVAAAELRPGDEPWLADLALPATDGEWYPAGELLLPGGRLAAVVAPDSPFGVCAAGEGTQLNASTEALLAVGVLDTFAVIDEYDIPVADLAELHLDSAETWAAPWGSDALIEHLVALRDLEWVDDWAGALPLLWEQREALTEPCRVLLADGTRITVPSYSRWWLARQPILNGRRPRDTTTAPELAGLYEPAAAEAALLGAWPSLAAILTDPEATAELLIRLGDPARTAAPELLAEVYARIAATGFDLLPPPRIRVAPTRVVPATEVVVVDQPWLWDRLGDRRPVLGGLPVAELLDVPLLSELCGAD